MRQQDHSQPAGTVRDCRNHDRSKFKFKNVIGKLKTSLIAYANLDKLHSTMKTTTKITITKQVRIKICISRKMTFLQIGFQRRRHGQLVDVIPADILPDYEPA